MNRYILYARKSTDEDDRQVLSIEPQIAELKEFAAKGKSVIWFRNMIEGKEMLHEHEALLSNAAFKRFASGFELYQKLFAEKTDSRDEIRNRMRALHVDRPKSYIDTTEGDEMAMVESHIALSENILGQCEEGAFTPTKFADALLSSKYGRTIIEEFTPKQAGKMDDMSGMVYVNEAMRYNFDDDERTQISLHIDPMDVSMGAALIKIKEGLRAVAIQLERKEIAATQISMSSWLINPKLAERLLGKGVEVKMEENTDDAIPALKFNKGKLETYLNTGESPLIGKIIITKEEFIRRILT